MGSRVADEFNDRASFRFNPGENVKAYVKVLVG